MNLPLSFRGSLLPQQICSVQNCVMFLPVLMLCSVFVLLKFVQWSYSDTQTLSTMYSTFSDLKVELCFWTKVVPYLDALFFRANKQIVWGIGSCIELWKVQCWRDEICGSAIVVPSQGPKWQTSTPMWSLMHIFIMYALLKILNTTIYFSSIKMIWLWRKNFSWKLQHAIFSLCISHHTEEFSHEGLFTPSGACWWYRWQMAAGR